MRVADPRLSGWTTFVVTAFSCGLMVGALLSARLLSRVGHIRAFSLLSALLSLGALGMHLVPEPPMWIAARLVAGACAGGGYVVIESWLSSVAPAERRGQTLAYYLILCHLGLAFGQTLIDGTRSGLDEILAAGLYVAALLPLVWTTTTQPVLPSRQRAPLSEVVKVAPVGICAAALSGVVTGSWSHAGGVLIERVVRDDSAVGPLMSALYLGGLVLQWPVGWLADRIDRRLVLQALGFLLAALHLGFLFLLERPSWFSLGLGAVGAIIFVIYPLALAHTQDLAPQDQSAGYGSVLLLSYGGGAILGPGVLGPLAMVDPRWFFIALAVMGGILFLVGGARVAFKPRLDIAQQVPFRPLLAPMAAPGQELDPRIEEEQLTFPF